VSVHKAKDGRWFVQYYPPGSRLSAKEYFGRGFEAELQARKWDQERKQARKQGKALIHHTEEPAGPAGITFNGLAQDYLTQQTLSPKHRASLVAILNAHVAPLFGAKPISELSMRDLSSLDARLIAHDLSIATRNRYQVYCKIILAWGIKHDYFPGPNPFDKFRMDKKREGKAPPPPSPDELQQILREAPDHLKWAIYCMVNLGLRPGPTELFRVKISDVDFQGQGIWIQRTKTHSPRVLQPARPEFLAAIKQLLEYELDRRFLIEYKGQPVLTLKTAWRHAKKRAGIPESRRLRLYDIRHFYATSMLSEGEDIKAVSELLGHSSVRMTMEVYYHILQGQKRGALDGLPSFPNPNMKMIPDKPESI
jgi:integrase